jgi:hypothetical protein
VSEWAAGAAGFNPGDKVWPKTGTPMELQTAPQTVLFAVSHHMYGDWLWLDDGRGGLRSWAAEYWATNEPRAQEIADQKEKTRQLAESVKKMSLGFQFILRSPRYRDDELA